MAKRISLLSNGKIMNTLIRINRLIFVLLLVISTSAMAKTECHSHSDCKDGKGCYPAEAGDDSDEDDEKLLIFFLVGKNMEPNVSMIDFAKVVHVWRNV